VLAIFVSSRIAFGSADVGHPDTYGLVKCFTTSTQPEVTAAWSDPWPVVPDPDDPNCFLYTATARDSISGIADHFQVDILAFIQANTVRKVIPIERSGKPPRSEATAAAKYFLGGPILSSLQHHPRNLQSSGHWSVASHIQMSTSDSRGVLA